MATRAVKVFTTSLEKDDREGSLQRTAFPIFIPENEYGIPEGQYSRNQFVRLLRENCRMYKMVYFLADMLKA